MTTNNNTVELIQQLLRMAEHPNSNEHEAALAMERAQALMLKANLTRAEISTTGEVTYSHAPVGQVDRVETEGYPWKSILLNALALSMLCRVVATPSAKTIHLFGTYDNVKAVLEMYQWLCPQLTSMAIRQFASYRENAGLESARSWYPQYYRGATHTIRTRLQESLETFTAGPGNAICLYNNKAVTEAVHKVFPKLSHTSSRTTMGDGYGAGRQAGSNINLRQHGQLTGRLALR